MLVTCMREGKIVPSDITVRLLIEAMDQAHAQRGVTKVVGHGGGDDVGVAVARVSEQEV